MHAIREKQVTLPQVGCVLRVGDGRGFSVEKRRRVHVPQLPDSNLRPRTFCTTRLIITAAHCLPQMPPAHRAADTEDLTYPNLLGSLDGTTTNVWAECLFADPVSDIAVLGSPDGQELYEQAEQYDSLIDEAPVVRIAAVEHSVGYCH